MDTKLLRTCFSRFATGVTVVTCAGENRPHGLTVNSFTSVSLDPPLVLVSVGRNTTAFELLHEQPFIVNILRSDQEKLAWHFAGRPDDTLRIRWEDGRKAPKLAGALAHIECAPWRVYDGGDHGLFVGEVERFQLTEGEPLLFYKSQFHRLPTVEEVAG